MQPVQIDHARESRLRFVFNDTVVSLSLATEVTLAEVAQKLDAFSTQRYGNPVAIDIILGSRESALVRRALRWPPVDVIAYRLAGSA